MVTNERRRARRMWLTLAWSSALLVFIVSLIPPPGPATERLVGLDKPLHAVMYAGLMFCYSKAYAKSLWLLLALALLGYGGLLELLQQFTPDRDPSIPDAIANLLGISIMLGIRYRSVRDVPDDTLPKGT
jgi:VanZ family protein